VTVVILYAVCAVFIPHSLLCHRPPFEVMEVWLEGLAMHLSVGMPLPQDLEFDIYNYTGM